MGKPWENCDLYEKIHHFQWVNPLFRLGNFQCRKLFVYQRVPTIFRQTPGRNWQEFFCPFTLIFDWIVLNNQTVRWDGHPTPQFQKVLVASVHGVQAMNNDLVDPP